ncbi:MAG: NAD(P)/FAD-dependent oxidoreductase [Nocardioidaceae bacterium]
MPRSVDIVIIGSGFAGLGMAIRLRQEGRDDFIILERAADLGGTWRDNSYPGCACDIPSYLYSYSFAQNPRWTRMFSPQREIWDYLRDCSKRYGLGPHLEYGAEVTSATWDEAAGRWLLEVMGSRPISCRVLVSGIGALHVPKIPEIAGLGSFSGTTFHSATWRHDLDLTGQRVAVVGTGASGVQVVPAIADRVKHLDVYQRTPAWILPRPDRAIRAAEHERFRRHPAALRLARNRVYWSLEARGVGFTVSARLQPVAERMARRYLERKVQDADLRARLTPTYEFGCKRALLSSDFYPAVQKPNVALVTSGIGCFTPRGIVDTSGVERPVDTVVLATGFDVSANVKHMDIVGRDGVVLNETWAHGVNAHLGIMVSGFPNLFLLLGPNTGLGHSSVVFMIESQISFVLSALRLLDGVGARAVDVRPEAQEQSVQAVQDDLVGTVWQSGCRSWYLDDTGRNISIWPRSTVRYWLRTRRLRRRDYRLDPGRSQPNRQIREGARA